MTLLRPGARAVAAGLAVALAWGAESARSYSRDEPIDPSSLPPWVRDASTRELPATSAGAASLDDELIVEPLAPGGVRETTRWVVRVLNEKGLDDAATCGVSYRSTDTVKGVSAWTVLPDGTAWKADPDRDVRDEPSLSGDDVVEGVRVRRAVAPHVVVGAAVACETIVREGLDPGAEGKFFGDATAPSAFERLVLRVPPGWGKAAVRIRADALEVRTEGDAIEAIGRNLAPLVREEMRPSARKLLPLVWVRWWSPDGSRGFSDWNAVARWTDALTSPVLADRGTADALAAGWKPKDASELLASLGKLFDYAARKVRYVAIEEGIGGWKPHTPAFVASHAFGDCKDKTFLMRAILQSWGYDSYPVDVRTSNLGPLDPRVPTYLQANHVVLAVPLPAGVGADLWSATDVDGLGRVLFLDATDASSNPWTLRDDVQGTRAVLYRGGRAILVDIPHSPPSAARADHALEATLDEQGNLTDAHLTERWTGIAGNHIRDLLAEATTGTQKHAWVDFEQNRFPGATVGDVTLEGIDRAGVDVLARTTFTAESYGKRVGGLLIVEPGRGSYSVVSGPLPPPPRHFPLDLGHDAEDHVVVKVTLPAGWVPEELPPPVEVADPGIAGRAAWTLSGGVLTYERTETLRATAIPPERYAAFRTAVMTMVGADRMGVVFVRKP